jgi:hypothetical protein
MKGALKSTVIVLSTTLGILILLEGLASASYSAYILFFRRISVMAEEQSHTEYDMQLGWVHRPSLYVENMYGPGVFFRSNAQRLRADHEFSVDVPAGKTRIICSGDSFAMGHSVSNDQAWCSLLEKTDSHIESVNMGQAGYGIDQAYLWYRRDGARLRHNVQLFSFITSDFDRMRYDNFAGFPKPYLRVAGDSLVVENVPVPKTLQSFKARIRMRDAVQNLRIVQFGLSLLKRVSRSQEEPEERSVLQEEELRPIVTRVLEDLKRLNAERGSTLVLVYLPKSRDGLTQSAEPWRQFIRTEAGRLGIAYVDLIEPFRQLNPLEGENLFVKPFAGSHYNPAGNAWIAATLQERLLAIPQIKTRLEMTQ